MEINVETNSFVRHQADVVPSRHRVRQRHYVTYAKAKCHRADTQRFYSLQLEWILKCKIGVK